MLRKRLSKRKRYLYITGLAFLLVGILGVTLDKYNVPSKIKQKYRTAEYKHSLYKHSVITKKLEKLRPDDAPFPYFSDVTRQAGITFIKTFEGLYTGHLPERYGSGIACGDIDNDGDDDLFLVSSGGPVNVPSTQYAPCKMFENLGDGTFKEYRNFPDTRIIGNGAAFGDFNGDGWQDLVVTGYNYISLFINVNGKSFRCDPSFSNHKHAASLSQGIMTGVSIADFDNDKDLDIYVTGVVHLTKAHLRDRRKGPRSYKPMRNLLFQNFGSGRFIEVAEKLGVSNPEGKSLGAIWYDFNNDGWLDLYVANDTTPNVFFLNLQGNFKEISNSAWVPDYRDSMGITAGDFDGDGDNDLFLSHWKTQENVLYESLFNERQEDSTEKGVLPLQKRLRFRDNADLRGLGQISLPFVGWGTEFVDLDNDGWLDLVVANGGLGLAIATEGEPKKLKPMRPFIFWSEKGKMFHDLAPLNEVLSTPHVGRGLVVSDINNDGRMDILINNKGEGIKLFRNEMKSGNWIKLRLKSFIGEGTTANGFGDGTTVIAHVGSKKFRRCVSSASYLSQSSKTVHIGLGDAENVDLLEVKWLGGEEAYFENLAANRTWVISEGKSNPMPVGQVLARRDRKNEDTIEMVGKNQIVIFWDKQRAAIRALKVEKEIPKAITLFQEALRLNPNHIESVYYLGMCFLSDGKYDKARESFEKLIKIEPSSHRGYQELGKLHARLSTSANDMEIAVKYLQESYDLNRTETGVLLMLAEIELLYGKIEAAQEHLSQIVRTNTRSVGGFFLLGYISWKWGIGGDHAEILNEAKVAKEGKLKSKIAVSSEGAVKKKMYQETTFFSQFWENWNSEVQNYSSVFYPLDNYLNQKRNSLDLAVQE